MATDYAKGHHARLAFAKAIHFEANALVAAVEKANQVGLMMKQAGVSGEDIALALDDMLSDGSTLTAAGVAAEILEKMVELCGEAVKSMVVSDAEYGD